MLLVCQLSNFCSSMIRSCKCKTEVKKYHGSWVLIIVMQTVKLHALLFCNDGTAVLLWLCNVLLPFRPSWQPNHFHPKASAHNASSFFLWVDVKIGGSMKHIVYILFIFHLLKVSNITPKQSLYSILFTSLVNFKWILNGSMVYTKLYRISDSVFFVMESRNSCW